VFQINEIYEFVGILSLDTELSSAFDGDRMNGGILLLRPMSLVVGSAAEYE